MTLVMCFIENGSHRSLLIFLSVIHSSRDSPFAAAIPIRGNPEGSSCALEREWHGCVCQRESSYAFGGDSKGDEVGPAVYCLAAVDGSVMVTKIAVWMARLLRFEGPNL